MNNSEILDEIDRLSVGQKFSTSSYYFDKLFQKSMEDDGEEGKKHLELLSRLCSISLSPEDEEKPYKPVFINHGTGTRSADVEDFTDEELAWLVQFAQEGRHPELIGKIFDISFIRTKQAKHALLALKNYAEALKTLIETNDAYEAVPILQRAISLIKRFNQFQNVGSPIQETVLSFMEGALATPEFPAYAGLGMSRPFLEVKESNHLRFAELCERVAKKFKEEGHFFKENEFYDLAASFYKRGRDNDRCNACLVKAAEVFEIAAGHQSNPMQAGNLLERAIEGYRSIGNSKEKVDELHRRLLESQSHTVNYMGRVESPKINISKQIEYAREHVKKETLLEAIYALSRIMSLPNYSELKESALKTIKEHPILFLFKKTGVDRRGRVIASIDPAIQSVSIGEDENPGLWAEIVEQAENHHQINAQAFILPAIQQIIDDHFLDEEELIPLLKSNPFVEPGHEIIWAKSIIYGLKFHWPECIHLLVPQIENSLRFLLENRGVLISKLDDEGTQEVLSLNFLLEHPELEKMLGIDLVTDLRVTLTDKVGSNLRNRMAHGLIAFDQFYSPTVVYTWWLGLLLVLLPMSLGQRGDEKPKDNEKDGEASAERSYYNLQN